MRSLGVICAASGTVDGAQEQKLSTSPQAASAGGRGGDEGLLFMEASQGPDADSVCPLHGKGAKGGGFREAL